MARVHAGTSAAGSKGMPFAIKAEIAEPRAMTFRFRAQKTMYGGKRVAQGDAIFVFASENEGFKFYRQATNKIVGISAEAAAFLRRFC